MIYIFEIIQTYRRRCPCTRTLALRTGRCAVEKIRIWNKKVVSTLVNLVIIHCTLSIVIQCNLLGTNLFDINVRPVFGRYFPKVAVAQELFLDVVCPLSQRWLCLLLANQFQSNGEVPVPSLTESPGIVELTGNLQFM